MKRISQVIIMITTVIKRVIAVLDIPTHVDDVLVYAQTIHDDMSASGRFGSSAAKLTQLASDLSDLQVMQVGAKSKPATHTTAERNEVLIKVQNDLRALKADVQAVADADPASAEVIIQSAGMKVKKEKAVNKQDFVAENAKVSGTVNLIAKGAGERSSHEWQKSSDGVNWTALPSTLKAKTSVSGLTRGEIMFFRHRAILKNGPANWCTPESVSVN